MQKEIEFICGERHEKSSKEGLVHNSRSDGSVGDSLHILFCKMGLGNCETGSQSWLKTRIEPCIAGFLEWEVAVIHLGHDKKAS